LTKNLLLQAKNQFSQIQKFSSFDNFSVKAVNNNGNAEIRIFGYIGEDEEYWGEGTNNTLTSLLGQIDRLNLTDQDTVEVLFSSQGGSVVVGNAFHNYIKEHPAKFVGIVLSEASSSAFTMLMGCDERVFNSSSFAVVHNPWTCGCGNQNDFKELSEYVQTIANGMIDIYTSVSNDTMDREAIIELMDNETLLDAKTALEMGFATEIREDSKSLSDSSVNSTREFFAEQRACFTGEVKSKREGVKGMSVKGDNPKKEKSTGDEGLQAKNNILQERLNTVESDLKASRKEVESLKAKTIEVDEAVAGREAQIRDEVIADMKQCTELVTKAQSSGFKAEGDTSVAIMHNVLAEAGVPNASTLSGDVLTEIFEFALAKNANKEVDDVFIDSDSVDAENDETDDIFASTKSK